MTFTQTSTNRIPMSKTTRKIKAKVSFIVGTIRNFFCLKKTEIVFASPRFKVIRGYTRRGTFTPNVLDVYFCGERENWKLFANIYQIPEGWVVEHRADKKWTFNRADVCIENEWWPEEYYFDDVKSLIKYMEEHFPKI